MLTSFYAVFCLAKPIKTIRSEPNNQTAAGTGTVEILAAQASILRSGLNPRPTIVFSSGDTAEA